MLLERLGLSERIDADRQLDRDTWPHQRAEFEAAFAAHPRAHWESVFADVDACVTPVLDMDEAPSHPHNVARGAFVTLDGVTQPAPAPRFSGTPTATPAPAPLVGAHTDEILADLGHDAEQIAQLRAQGVVG